MLINRLIKADLDFQFPWPKLATDPISTLWNWWPALFQEIREFSIKIRLVANLKIENIEIVKKTTNYMDFL